MKRYPFIQRDRCQTGVCLKIVMLGPGVRLGLTLHQIQIQNPLQTQCLRYLTYGQTKIFRLSVGLSFDTVMANICMYSIGKKRLGKIVELTK